MDAVKSAEKPAITVHIGIQHDQRKQRFSIIIYEIQYKISHTGNRVFRAVFISSFGKNSIFSRGKNLRQLLLIAAGTHFTVMVSEHHGVGNLKTIQKCQQLFRLLFVVHRAAFREKRENGISGQNHQIRLCPEDQFRHRCHGQFVLFSGKETEAKVQIRQLQYFIISVRGNPKRKGLFVPYLKVFGSIHTNLFSFLD